MDDPNITMEEYIRLEEEKAQKRGKVFNWETAKYVSEYDEEEQNVLYFNDLFPFNIIHLDDLKSEKDNDDMALPPHDQRHQYLRLCHRLIACSIAGRSQAPEKVIATDLFYLRGMDVGSVNVPCLLARYLILFAAGKKSRAHISGGQFAARLAEHFGLLTAKILQGLTICMEVDDTWAWVSMGPERQPNATAGAPGVAQDAPAVDEGVQAVLAPVQAP
ncbi:hypothetical protein Tco_1339011 [Tanacetum coccineum]